MAKKTGKTVVSRTRLGKIKINQSELRRRGAAMKRYGKVLDSIVDRVQLAMENKRMSASYLADCALLCRGTIYRLLDGKTRFPQIRTLEYIATALNVPIWWLVHGEDAPKFEGINPKAVRPKRSAA